MVCAKLNPQALIPAFHPLPFSSHRMVATLWKSFCRELPFLLVLGLCPPLTSSIMQDFGSVLSCRLPTTWSSPSHPRPCTWTRHCSGWCHVLPLSRAWTPSVPAKPAATCSGALKPAGFLKEGHVCLSVYGPRTGPCGWNGWIDEWRHFPVISNAWALKPNQSLSDLLAYGKLLNFHAPLFSYIKWGQQPAIQGCYRPQTKLLVPRGRWLSSAIALIAYIGS